jgi:hypothetical protein
MVIYGFLLILLLRPSWALWGFFSIAAAIIFFLAGMGSGLDATNTALLAGVEGVIFSGLGALIVFLRLKFKKGSSNKDKEIDAELARICAEASARESQPTAQ